MLHNHGHQAVLQVPSSSEHITTSFPRALSVRGLTPAIEAYLPLMRLSEARRLLESTMWLRLTRLWPRVASIAFLISSGEGSPIGDSSSHEFQYDRLSPSMSADAVASGRMHGWVEQPNNRGTFDIIWTCIATIIAATYSMLCLNVPAPGESFLRLFSRGVLWMSLGIISPEFPLIFVAGQWNRAKHSVKAFHTSGYNDWHMRQAFFADMGGFVLQTPDAKPFPLNSAQLHWLVVNKFVEYPNTTCKEIWDKSKHDTFTRAIAVFQITYLIIQCIGRAAQGLAITSIELNALAIVVCSLITSYIWLHKPADVQTPIVIRTQSTIAEITLNRNWSLMPLDFIDDHSPGYSVNVQPFMNMPVLPSVRPIQRIPNDRFPTNPDGTQEYFLCFATLTFTGIHVAGWNFDYPTPTERLLWRISSSLLFGTTLTFCAFETIASWTRLGRWKTVYLYIFDKAAVQEHKRRLANRSTTIIQRESDTFSQLWEFAGIAPLAIIFGTARLYLLAEGFAELRNMERTAYVNIEWTDFFPHV